MAEKDFIFKDFEEMNTMNAECRKNEVEAC